MPTPLDNIKLLLGIEQADASKDDLLNLLLFHAQEAIRVHAGVASSDPFPEELQWIANELTIIKYHRLGYEGISDRKEDVFSYKYEPDIIQPYLPAIYAYIQTKTGSYIGKKRLRML